MHEHFDQAGEKTGHTVVTRESMWSESARGRVLALVQHEDSICKCGCGLPMQEAHRLQAFKVSHFRCYAQRAIEGEKKAHRAREEAEAKKNRLELPEDWGVGLHYYAAVHDPSD